MRRTNEEARVVVGAFAYFPERRFRTQPSGDNDIRKRTEIRYGCHGGVNRQTRSERG